MLNEGEKESSGGEEAKNKQKDPKRRFAGEKAKGGTDMGDEQEGGW